MAACLAACSAWTLPKSMAEPLVPATGAGTAASAGAQSQEVADAVSRFKARDFEAH